MKTERVNVEPKRTNTEIPDGAEILEDVKSTDVEEIENGFIVSRRREVKFKINGYEDWAYQCKKRYSKTNPVKVDKKTLAEKFK